MSEEIIVNDETKVVKSTKKKSSSTRKKVSIKNPLSGVTDSVIAVEKRYVNNNEFANGFSMLYKGFYTIGRESGLSLYKIGKSITLSFHHSFTHHPYPWCCFFIGAMIIWHTFSVGEARVERDMYMRSNYELGKKLDSLNVITDFYASYNKTLSGKIDSLMDGHNVDIKRAVNREIDEVSYKIKEEKMVSPRYEDIDSLPGKRY